MCDMDDFSDDGTDELLCSLPNDVFSEAKNGIEKEKITPTFPASNSSSAAPDIKNVILRTPEEFPFPFEPYGIQLHFMKALYKCLQEGKIGIFESPTGTGKSLSLICGAFKWLRDFKEQQQKELDDLLAKKICETHVNNGPKELDWITEFSIKKKTEEELKQLEEEKKTLTNVENKLGHMRERYHKPSKRKCHQLESKFEELKDSFSDELQKAFMAEMSEINNQNSTENGENEDVELVVEEYFSDNEEKIKSGSDDEEDDHVEQEHTLKIYYCSRTHSQLSQFVREIMKSPYGEDAKVTSLASRQNLCVNEAVQNLKSLTLMNDRCLELQKSKKGSKSKSDQPKKRSKTNNCPFYKVERIEDFRDRVLVEVRDIEQLVTLGKQMKSCPYYGTRYAIPNAEIVLLPYNTLLHRTTRESCGIKVKDNIIIIDEAHNLLETINNIHSVEVTGAQMCRAHSQLSQYEQRYRNRLKAKNLMYINQILFILSRFVNYIGGKLDIASNEQHLSKIESKIMTINDFLYETKLDNINLFKVLNYCKKSLISKKLNGFVEKYQPSSVNYVPLKAKEPENNQSGVSQFLKELSEKNKSSSDQVTKAALQAPENITSAPEMNSPLMHIEGFLEALTNADKDGRMVLNRKSLLSVSSIKFLLLNPAVEFEVIVNEARSVVIAGGTMQPVSEFKEQLFCSIGVHPERILEYSCGHVIPDNHLLPIALATGPSGREMDFTYQYRDRPQTLEELGHVICNICNIVPGGIVCFFPSYDYEAKVFDFWSKSGVIRRISSKKKVFRESRKPGESDAVLANYSDCVRKLRGPSTSNGPMGAILFSVVGGKMSEGINFSDDLGRCVILVGLPFPNINSPELKEKMDYLNANYPRSSDGRMPGQIHYENLCMKAVNQSIGRAIRHQKDYAIVLLLDRRYQKPSVAAKLPNWIRTLLKNCKFGQAVGAISKFFASKN